MLFLLYLLLFLYRVRSVVIDTKKATCVTSEFILRWFILAIILIVNENESRKKSFVFH